jgi:glycosyltransferase involved in cell wall biosynthesis
MSSRKINIAFVINSIGSGGAEAALFNIIKGMPEQLKKDIELHLILLDDEPRHRPIPKDVVLHQLDAKRSLFKSVTQTYSLLKTIEPVLTVSFLVRSNIVNSLIRLRSKGHKSIICERMHLSSHLNLQFSPFKAKLAMLLPMLLYKFNDLSLGVSTGVTENLIHDFKVKRSKISTVFNPYDIALLQKRANAHTELDVALPNDYFVNVGRLTKSKDHATLIRGFAKSSTKRSLVIIGVGELEQDLRRLSLSLGISERVIFTGYLSNPHAIIRHASFFISSSKNEGFPNALLESMVLAKPCIFTSCDSGPAEIMGESHNFKASTLTECEFGVLIPEGSINEVTNAINFFENPQHLQKYTKASQQRARHFTLSKIAQQYWEKIILVAGLPNKPQFVQSEDHQD